MSRIKIIYNSDNKDKDDFDVDTYTDVEARKLDAKEVEIVSFDAGDVVGKILAFIAQI